MSHVDPVVLTGEGYHLVRRNRPAGHRCHRSSRPTETSQRNGPVGLSRVWSRTAWQTTLPLVRPTITFSSSAAVGDEADFSSFAFQISRPVARSRQYSVLRWRDENPIRVHRSRKRRAGGRAQVLAPEISTGFSLESMQIAVIGLNEQQILSQAQILALARRRSPAEPPPSQCFWRPRRSRSRRLGIRLLSKPICAWRAVEPETSNKVARRSRRVMTWSPMVACLSGPSPRARMPVYPSRR